LLLLYRAIFFLIVLIGSPYLLIKAIWGKHGISERLGIISARRSIGRLFWFHAASVGELKVLSTVIPELKKILPEVEIAISTTTATGKRRARQLFPDAFIFLQPLEINSAILRVVENLRPEKLILVETELWPLLINTVADRGVEIFLINARMSARSFKFYRWFRTLVSKTISRITGILAQSQLDADRFAHLGAGRIQVVGNTKFDQVFTESLGKESAITPPANDLLVFVAGSVRKGEDEIFADVIASSLLKKLPVFFALAPRHMKDVGELRGHLNARNIAHSLWTQTGRDGVDFDSVLIVDTMGDLTSFYKSADLAFVGGSIVPIGGHDPAEPAALAVPVLFGPHMENADFAARLLLKRGAASEVRNADDIIRAIENAFKDRQALKERGLRGREAIASAAGVSSKLASIIAGIKA